MADEKRRFTRFPFKMKAELRVKKTRYETEEINNLSIGGCLLSIPKDLEPETQCSLRIILKTTGSEPTISVNGTVVRCEQGNVAIKFTGIDPDSLFHLQKIALYNAPNPDNVEQEIKDRPGIV